MSRTSGKYWAAGLGSILAIDAALVLSGDESLSECFARNLRHPVRGPIISVATVYLVMHLSGCGGEKFNKYDPLHRVASVLR